MQAAQQSMAVQQTQQQQQAAAAPPPDVLYNNALRDYQAGKNDLAAQEFADYVKYLSQHRSGGKFEFLPGRHPVQAGQLRRLRSKSYDQVLQSFPDGNKAAAAELKKGLGAGRTGTAGSWDCGTAACDPALSQVQRSRTGPGPAAQAGSGGLRNYRAKRAVAADRLTRP